MEHGFIAPAIRRVRIETTHGPIEGSIRIGPRARTLDDLNQEARDFVILRDPELKTNGWSPGRQPLAISKATVLFVTEVSDFIPGGDVRGGEYTRASMTLVVGDFVIRGFVHLPPGGDPLLRLNQQHRSFLALTSASVVGPHAQFAAGFIAVNRSHVSTAQGMDEASLTTAAATGAEDVER
jgi:hypothetical protein